MNMLEAQLNQARGVAQRAVTERETWVRVAVCLARAILDAKPIRLVNGNLVIMRTDLENVPKAWQVGLAPAKVSEENDPPDVEPKDALMVVVSKAADHPLLVIHSNGVA